MNKEVFDDIGRVLSGAAEAVSRKAGEAVELTRLKNQIFSLEREIKRDYTDLAPQMNLSGLSARRLPRRGIWLNSARVRLNA